MPTKPPRLCAHCQRLITTPRCLHCSPAWGTSKRGGSTRRWRLLRVSVFAEQEHICAIDGCTELCVELDHIISVARGGGDERDNVQGLCTLHHAQKTQQESFDGRTI